MLLKLLLCTAFLSINIYSQLQTSAFINSKNALLNSPESKAAFEFLKMNSHTPKAISFDEVSNTNLSGFNLIWLHKDDTTAFSEDAVEPAVKKALLDYIEDGGSLLLTLDAVNFLATLGLEKDLPSVQYMSAVDEGYGRKLGLHAYLSHPIFEGLNGGAYIWNAYEDNTARQVGYFDDVIPNGKVAAVDWAYITLNENKKLVLEYTLGKGKVLAVGAYTYYAPKNFNRGELEAFTKNCFNYLTGKIKGTANYWNYKPQEVINKNFSSEKISLKVSPIWDKKNDLPSLNLQFASDNFCETAGQRLFLMGKEKGGIDEVWIHPFMAFRDYEVGVQFEYKDTIYWLNEQRPQLEVKPESFTRTYQFRRAYITEVVTASIDNPAAVIHYEYRGVYPAKLIIKYKSNLRLMWPYSHKAIGTLHCGWDDGLNAFRVENEAEKYSALIGFNKKPLFKLSGSYDNFIKKDSIFTGIAAEKFQAAGISVFEIGMYDNFDVVIAGSDQKDEAQKVYKEIINNTQNVYLDAVDYYKKFIEDKLIITTPDKDFNEGYLWALINTDKFFVNTPEIGKSLLAGYSTTARGWNGAQEISGRPGYAWYFGRDGQWSGFALTDYGDFEKVKEILKTFNKYQNVNGKIFHELTTSGIVHYDAADATPLYIILAGHYLKLSGDIEFIREIWPNIKKAVEYCQSTDTDGDHLIENTNVGHGWVEGGSLYGAHSTLYLSGCWSAALSNASYISAHLGYSKEAEDYNKESILVRTIINKDFWNKDLNFYYYGKFKDGTFNPERTTLPAVPLYFNLADSNKTKPVLETYAGVGFSSDWGTRIVSEESPLFNPRGYHYGSVWPLFTGWIALAEYKNRHYIQGFSHIMNNLLVYKNFSIGYVEEVINGAEYAPTGVCPHQCWSETMVLQPALEGMLGLSASVLENKFTLSPSFPFSWDSVNIKNIRTGNNKINMTMRREKGKTVYRFTNNGSRIKLDFIPSFPPGTQLADALLNKSSLQFNVIKEDQAVKPVLQFELGKEAELVITYSGGISILPSIDYPKPGDASNGIRIISAGLDQDRYVVKLESLPGNEGIVKIYSLDDSDLVIENGTLVSREGNISTIKVAFDKTGERYSQKTLTISYR